MANESSEVMFDVLLVTAGSGQLPHGENVQDFYAAADDIEFCRRWFAGRGMILHATPFGLSGSAPRALFESVFAAKLEPLEAAPGQPGFRILVEPKPPAELADLIDQVTIAAAPEMFN